MITGNEIMGMMQNYLGSVWPGAQQWVFPMILAFSAFFALLFIGLWIYTSIAYSEIARKLKYKKSWLAWIPFARSAMILQLGDFNWAFVFLWLVPILGWIAVGILLLISEWRIFEKRKYYGWLALTPLVGVIPYLMIFAQAAHLVILGFIAWQDKKRKR
ncbi:MAG: hypothetical protein WAU65_00405 [Candidatus Nanoarchaeia archaeon]